jgi:dephospho-CoA kinase
MIRVLLTGMSGTGKSSLVAALAELGHKAVDLDAPEWSHWAPVEPSEDPAESGTPVEPDRDWVWQEDRVRQLLETEDVDLLFVSGCAINQRMFRSLFDHVLLLTASRDVILRRLTTRSTGYGTRPEEAARVLSLIDTVEPRLRQIADHVIDTNASLSLVVDRVLRLVRATR